MPSRIVLSLYERENGRELVPLPRGGWTQASHLEGGPHSLRGRFRSANPNHGPSSSDG